MLFSFFDLLANDSRTHSRTHSLTHSLTHSSACGTCPLFLQVVLGAKRRLEEKEAARLYLLAAQEAAQNSDDDDDEAEDEAEAGPSGAQAQPARPKQHIFWSLD